MFSHSYSILTPAKLQQSSVRVQSAMNWINLVKEFVNAFLICLNIMENSIDSLWLYNQWSHTPSFSDKRELYSEGLIMQKLHHLIATVIIPWPVLTRLPSSIHQEHDPGHTEIIITNLKPAKKQLKWSYHRALEKSCSCTKRAWAVLGSGSSLLAEQNSQCFVFQAVIYKSEDYCQYLTLLVWLAS